MEWIATGRMKCKGNVTVILLNPFHTIYTTAYWSISAQTLYLCVATSRRCIPRLSN